MNAKDWLIISVPYCMPVIAAVAIFAFFRLIKQYDVQQLSTFGAQAYVSADQFVTSAFSFSRLCRFLLYRIIPPCIILLFEIAVLQKLNDRQYILLDLLITSLLFSLCTDIPGIKTAFTFGEKTLHVILVISYLGLSLFFTWCSRFIDISFLSPSIAGLVDNTWSALFVALIIAVYVEVFRNEQSRQQSNQQQEITRYNAIVKRQKRICSKFNHIIENACKVNCTSYSLLLSILIIEDINRPAPIRFIERQAVKIPGVELTIGLAQVKSNKPISDEESIYKAAYLLKNTDVCSLTEKSTVLHRYNNDDNYIRSINYIEQIVSRNTDFSSASPPRDNNCSNQS